MKIVINGCYGGFATSAKADALLRATECPHVKRPEEKPHYGYGHDDAAARTCPHLIAVVEKLGDDADGAHADLRVIEIPDGVQWEIDEYDGIEHVAEVHRTWR